MSNMTFRDRVRRAVTRNTTTSPSSSSNSSKTTSPSTSAYPTPAVTPAASSLELMINDLSLAPTITTRDYNKNPLKLNKTASSSSSKSKFSLSRFSSKKDNWDTYAPKRYPRRQPDPRCVAMLDAWDMEFGCDRASFESRVSPFASRRNSLLPGQSEHVEHVA